MFCGYVLDSRKIQLHYQLDQKINEFTPLHGKLGANQPYLGKVLQLGVDVGQQGDFSKFINVNK